MVIQGVKDAVLQLRDFASGLSITILHGTKEKTQFSEEHTPTNASTMPPSFWSFFWKLWRGNTVDSLRRTAKEVKKPNQFSQTTRKTKNAAQHRTNYYREKYRPRHQSFADSAWPHDPYLGYFGTIEKLWRKKHPWRARDHDEIEAFVVVPPLPQDFEKDLWKHYVDPIMTRRTDKRPLWFSWLDQSSYMGIRRLIRDGT